MALAGLGVVDAIGMAFGVFGLGTGSLGIVSFSRLNPAGGHPKGPIVQIKAGLGDSESSGLGGTIESVSSYDFGDKWLGTGKSCSMGNGGICEITIDQETPGTQADYIRVSNSVDASCISWVSVTQFDQSPGGAWTGDIGAACGAKWYYGNQEAGKLPDGSPYRPMCTWLDKDHTNFIEWRVMKFAVRAYGELSNQTLSQSLACDSTVFGNDFNQMASTLPASPSRKRSTPPAKRSLPARLPWMEHQLIVSNVTNHMAEALCTSDTAYGPDFVGPDGYFCDMKTKTLSPLCSTQQKDGCVEVDEEAAQVKVKRSVARREVSTAKRYKIVTRW